MSQKETDDNNTANKIINTKITKIPIANRLFLFALYSGVFVSIGGISFFITRSWCFTLGIAIMKPRIKVSKPIVGKIKIPIKRLKPIIINEAV